MRLIDADKLLEYMNELESNNRIALEWAEAQNNIVGKISHRVIIELLSGLADYINDIQILEWIPVTEGLPEKGKKVFTTVEIENEDKELYREVYDDYIKDNGEWFYGEMPEIAHITAWMSMPEPYKGE